MINLLADLRIPGATGNPPLDRATRVLHATDRAQLLLLFDCRKAPPAAP